MKQNTMKIFVFFAIIVFWAYFSFPIEILQVKDQNGLATGEYAYTIEAKAYVHSYFTTLGLTMGGILIGIVLGFFLAFLRFLEIQSLNFIIDEYIDIIRGTPLLLQLLIFSVVIFATWSDNFYVAIIALGLNSSAYVAEIVRSGIQSVDKGQMEAARAMGLNYSASMRLIIFPQAIKNILPSLMNEFISLFKETSIVGYISVMDITMQSKSLQAIYYNPKPIIFTGLVYYVSVKILTLIARLIEVRLNKHD
ncbi:amino acid ABC transporter permease [Campylobacter lari]|uniref:amino acid ABC transporter permease n=1 Tax=Campylobacter lari TaxID=201 RepID=UPI0021BFAE16|nr:amino acid ABC transporter permease [Campylobacter lari]